MPAGLSQKVNADVGLMATRGVSSSGTIVTELLKCTTSKGIISASTTPIPAIAGMIRYPVDG
jgi:hypothetical protein